MFNSSSSANKFNSLTTQTKSTTTLSDRLSSQDRNDSFTINLRGRSSINATLNGIARGANVDLELRNSQGQVVAASRKAGRKAESIQTNLLDAGIYTLRTILKGKATTGYRLQYSAIAFAPPDSAGNEFTTAREITVGTTPATYSDYIGSSDPTDVYRFALSSDAPTYRLSYSYNWQGPFPDGVSLYKITGSLSPNPSEAEVFRASTQLYPNDPVSSGSAGSYTRLVTPGTYYFEVGGSLLSDANYNLTLSATAITDLAGNTATAARTLTVGATPTTMTDFVGLGDRTDYYAFTVGQNSNLNFNISGVNGAMVAGGTNVYLRNSALNQVRHVYSTEGGVSLANHALTPGTYYLQVEPFSTTKSSDYSLTISAS